MTGKTASSLIFLLALMLFTAAYGCKTETPQAAKVKEPRKVTMVQAIQGTLPRTVTLSGTLAADEALETGFKVAGRVKEIMVDLGSMVSKDQLLARLDPKDFLLRVEQSEAALRQARARLGLPPEGDDERVDPEKTALVKEAKAVLNEARLARDRAAKLLEKDYISKTEFDSAVARILVAESRYQSAIEEILDRQAVLAQRKSELALARQQLSDTELYSPLKGAVSSRMARVGAYLEAGAAVVSLVSLHPLRLEVEVPEREASVIHEKQSVKVRIEGQNTEHQGRVVRISPVIAEKSRTLTVEAEIDNRQGLLRPGSFARAEILIKTGEPAVLVPYSAIVTFAGIEKVIGEKDGRVTEQRVRTGRRSGDMVEIIEGLVPGVQVIADPGNLSNGQPVTVAK